MKSSLYHRTCCCRLVPNQSDINQWAPCKGEVMICSLANRAAEPTVVCISIESPGGDKTSFCRERKDALCDLVNTGTNTQTLRSLPEQE